MTIKHDIDRFIDDFPWVGTVRVDCSRIGGRRIFGGNVYRDKALQFIGESRATKLRKEAEREQEFKAAQQSLISDAGPQT